MPRYNPNRLYKPSRRTICTICREETKEKTSDYYPHGPRFVVADNDTRASPDRITSDGQLWYHQSCYEILASSYVTAEIPIKKKIREFYQAITPIYPVPKHQRRVHESMREGLLFSEHAKGLFEACFSQALLRRLPEEILCTILEYVGRCRYLMVLGETRRLLDQWRISCEDNYGHERASTSKHVFLTRIGYRGVSYISKISNVPFEKPSDEGFPGEMLSLPPNTRRLLVSKDHMGVRDIRPIVDGLELSADGSPWYEVLGEPNTSLNAEIEVSYNGLFLRDVWSTATDRDSKRGSWSIPCPPYVKPWNVEYIGNRARSWLHYTQLDGGVKGLTVCCWHYRNIGFHSFTRLSADYRSFVSHMKQQYSPRYLTWMYFPINAGESITDIRTLNGGTLHTYCASSGPAIVVETSLHRTVTFGAYVPPKAASSTQLGSQMGPHQSRSLLRSDDGAISGLFHNGSNPLSPYITEFGAVCDPRRARERPEQIASAEQYPYPIPLVTSDLHYDEWYMTKARLEGLISVQFCQDTTRVHYPCIGLLLHYGDGHVESLGQFRWDLIISDRIPTPIRVEISHDMVRDRFIPYIGAVETLPPFYSLGGDQWHEWKNIPQHGVIVWWTNPKMGDQIALYNS